MCVVSGTAFLVMADWCRTYVDGSVRCLASATHAETLKRFRDSPRPQNQKHYITKPRRTLCPHEKLCAVFALPMRHVESAHENASTGAVAYHVHALFCAFLRQWPTFSHHQAFLSTLHCQASGLMASVSALAHETRLGS